ncbi:MAG TPA: CDP-alcohol phosphatidyltransferase family protein [Dehalococcoidia bacterium]|nr:CDP-alcohol phosphatidyltransferase family protein [Dehalococcoidia bacterium]
MSFRRKIGNSITAPLIPFLGKIGLTPDAVTWAGLLIILAAAVLVALNHLLIGGILVLLSGLCDILDGALARYRGRSSKFGALLDSTFDRISEAAVLFGLVYLYSLSGNILLVSLSVAAIIFSFLISYVKARAEGLGLTCEVGLFTRTERVLVMAAGLICNLVWIALIIMVLFSFITMIQRLVHVYRRARSL